MEAILSATILAFCLRATITLKRSKSFRLALVFFAFNFFAHEVVSHLLITSLAWRHESGR